MAMTAISMAAYVNYIDQECSEQWRSLATIRGHSVPNMMENNGKKKSYKLLDASGKLIKEIKSENIGRKPSFNACLKEHGIFTPLIQLTGPGKDAAQWFFSYQIKRHEQDGIKLDEGAYTFINDCTTLFTSRQIMWNKHHAYVEGDKTAFAGDKDIHRYMLALVLENQIKDPAIESGIAAAKTKLLTFEKYISMIGAIDASLAEEMQTKFDDMRKELQEEVPVTIDGFLSEWSTKYLLPEVLNIRALRSASEVGNE